MSKDQEIMSSYSRVHYEDRLKIEVLLKAGAWCVCNCKVDWKTSFYYISREIKRGRVYIEIVTGQKK